MNETLTSIRRTPYQSLAAFFVLFFNLFLSVTILSTLAFLHGFLGYVETRPQVTVYFKTQTTSNDVFRMRDTLISSGKILSVKYISKEEAFNIYKDLNKANPLLVEMISADIFPSSLEIYAKKPQYLAEIANFFKKQAGVDEINFQKLIIDRLLTITSIMRKSSLIFFGFLIAVTIIVLSTITHFKVALKKDEIELLRLIGASNFYIQKPFLLEAVFFGFFSGIFSYLVFLIILLSLNSSFSSYLSGIKNLSINFDFYQITVWPLNVSFMLVTFIFTCVFGVIISTLASFLATRKYIKSGN